MAEKPDVVEIDPEVRATLAEIDQARRQFAEALGLLKENPVLQPLDLTKWVGNHPVESSLGAAAVGFMLAQSGGNGSILGTVARGSVESMIPSIVPLLFRSLM
ncbi:MAG TPA: hypothetical protein VFW45_15320 [Candidatus Polarisedimenticolia bacterium]|nr:hypothetical protein [Candidatus Polarisedimenticolia bacterium]